MLYLKLLLLLIIANGVPIIANLTFAGRYDHPVDFGRNFLDGKPLFGTSKTIRGVILAILFTSLGSVVLGLSWKLGLILGVGAMLGDLVSSFIKRRFGMEPSSMALGLDQIPESLLPLIAISPILGLEWQQVLTLVVLFTLIELSLSRVLFKLKIRKRPY